MKKVILRIEKDSAGVDADVTNMPLSSVGKLGTYYERLGYDLKISAIGVDKFKIEKENKKEINYIQVAIGVASFIVGACAIMMWIGAE